MKGLAIYAVVVSIVAVGALGVAVGFFVSRATDSKTESVQVTAAPTERAQPHTTEYVPVLTGVEAAAKAKSQLIKAATDAGLTGEALTNLIRANCETQDFNSRDRAWIVKCGDPGLTLRVFDSSGKIEVVN